MAPKNPQGAVTEAVSETEDVLSGGGDGGGGGGAGSNPADKQRPYRSALMRLGIPIGPYRRLIAQAATEGWSADEFYYELSLTTEFLKTFPGITALTDQGMSITQAVTYWKQVSSAYEQAAKDTGLVHLARLTPQRIGVLISNNVSADEFKMRLGFLDLAKNTSSFRDAFNRVLKNNGQKELDQRGWYRFIMGKGENALYDLYEGTVLLEQLGPQGLATRSARKLARALSPGKLADLSTYQETIGTITSQLGTQMLADAGIRVEDLALVALKDQIGSGDIKQRAAEVEGMLSQMLTNAQAQAKGAQQGGVYVRQGRPVSTEAPQGELAG